MNTTTKRPMAVILCGPPGSGKTTYRNQLTSGQFEVLSTDDIVAELGAAEGLTYSEAFGKYIGQATTIYNQRFREAVAAKRNIVVDRTHTTAQSRARTLQHLSDYETTAVWFPVKTVDELITRVKQREEKTGQGVPEPIVRSMYKSFTQPNISEGFTYVVKADQI